MAVVEEYFEGEDEICGWVTKICYGYDRMFYELVQEYQQMEQIVDLFLYQKSKEMRVIINKKFEKLRMGQQEDRLLNPRFPKLIKNILHKKYNGKDLGGTGVHF